MSNYHLRDKRMTWKAKGLLSVMLSLPEEWDYSIAGLSTISDGGLAVVRSGLKELETFGYLIRKPVKEKGKIVDWEYTVFEKPHVEKPHVDFQHVEKPQVENRTQLNTNQLNTKEINTKEIKDMPAKQSSSRFKKPTIEEVRSYCQERKNRVDPERFFDYYESNGWKIGGKSPMKDWKAAVRNWERGSNSYRQGSNVPAQPDYGSPEDFYN